MPRTDKLIQIDLIKIIQINYILQDNKKKIESITASKTLKCDMYIMSHITEHILSIKIVQYVKIKVNHSISWNI